MRRGAFRCAFYILPRSHIGTIIAPAFRFPCTRGGCNQGGAWRGVIAVLRAFSRRFPCPVGVTLPRVLSAHLRAFYGNGGGRSNGGGRVAFSHNPISSQRRRRARSVALHPNRVHAFPFPYQGGTGGAGGITAGRYNGGGVTCRGLSLQVFQ